MYRAGRLRRVFRARGKLVGTSDFVVTKGYVQIRVVGFPMGDRLARGRSAAPGRRAAPPPRAGGSSPVGVPVGRVALVLISDRYAIRTRNLQDWNLTRYRCANRSKATRNEDAAAVRSRAA